MPVSGIRRRALHHVLSTIVVAIVGIYFLRNQDRLVELLNLSAGATVILFILSLMSTLANGITNYFLYRPLGAKLSLPEAISLGVVNSLANLLPFSGGIVAKAFYLHRKFRLSYTDFLGATSALYVTFVATSGILGITAYLGLIWSGGGQHSLMLLLGFVAMALALALFAVPLHHLRTDRLRTAVSGWIALSSQKDSLLLLTLIHTIGTLVFAGRLSVAFQAFSVEVSIIECLVFASGVVLTQLVSITPGAFGIREGIVAAMAALLGFEPGVAAFAVALDRLVETGIIMIGGMVSATYLSQKSITNEVAEIENCSPPKPTTSLQ